MPASDLLSGLNDQLTALIDQAAGIVSVQAGPDSVLSGIHWRPGLVVTAEERLDPDLGREESLTVTTQDGRQLPASLIGRDPSTDVALLEIDGAGVPAAETASAAGLRAGMVAIGVGRYETGPVAALGIVGFAGGAWRSSRGGVIDGLIRLDLTLDPVAEGGALIDGQGRVLGMTVFGPRRGALAIPTATIDRTVGLLLDTGCVPRGYLGAGLQRVLLGKRPNAGGPLERGLPERGLLVVSLDPDGPAAKAGLLIGDILTGWNGAPLSRIGDVMSALGPDSVGSAIELRLLRAGASVLLKLALGQRPAA